MRVRWLCAVLNTCLLLASIALLLVFMHLFTVPHALTGDFTRTSCLVTAFHSRPLLLPVLSDRSGKAIDRAAATQRTQTNWSPVPINETSPQGVTTDEVLANHTKPIPSSVPLTTNGGNWDNISDTGLIDSGQDLNILPAMHLRPFCQSRMDSRPGCVLECNDIQLLFMLYSGEEIVINTTFQSSWVYYRMTTNKYQCPCPDCKMVAVTGHNRTLNASGGSRETDLAMRLGTRLLHVQDSVTCLYNPRLPTEVILSRHSTILVLNAMLWPTLLFIITFVGVFFSCLLAQKEGCDCTECCTCIIWDVQ